MLVLSSMRSNSCHKLTSILAWWKRKLKKSGSYLQANRMNLTTTGDDCWGFISRHDCLQHHSDDGTKLFSTTELHVPCNGITNPRENSFVEFIETVLFLLPRMFFFHVLFQLILPLSRKWRRHFHSARTNLAHGHFLEGWIYRNIWGVLGRRLKICRGSCSCQKLEQWISAQATPAGIYIPSIRCSH